MAKEPIVVVFRMLGNQCIALFPTIAAVYNDPSLCMSYMHVGQHGAAQIGIGRKARPAEYRALKRELQQIGYHFRVVSKACPTHYVERRKQCGFE